MALIRSAFVVAFMAYLVSASGYAGMQLLRGMEPAWSWFGMLLASAAPLAFFGWIMVAAPPRTDRHPVGFSIFSGLGLAITLTMSWRYGEAAGVVHAWAATALIGWFAYLRWYSSFRGRGSSALRSGTRLPRFELFDPEGKPVDSHSLTDQPAVWVIHRGNWCPFCMAQIGELARRYREIVSMGARVIFVSPQSPARNRALAEKFEIPALFMQDRDNRVAKLLGILNHWGVPLGMQLLGYDSDTAMPTVIVTDAFGTIIYAHETDNYRIRPEPDRYIEVLARNIASC